MRETVQASCPTSCHPITIDTLLKSINESENIKKEHPEPNLEDMMNVIDVTPTRVGID